MITKARVGDLIYLRGYARNQYEGTITQLSRPDQVEAKWHNHPSKNKAEKYYLYSNFYNFSDMDSHGAPGSMGIIHVPKRKPTIII